jgi:hypothetical protein
MNDWSAFFSAMAESAATLTGLIFVGVSISLKSILEAPQLPGRALESLILLLTILLVSALYLVPGQTSYHIGIEVLILSAITWVITLIIDINILRKTDAEYKKHSWMNMLFTQLSVLPYLLGGVIMLCQGYAGIYWMIPGMLFSFIKAVMDAWVLLVEIHR